MKQVTIRIDDEIHKEIKHLMVEIEISINTYINQLIKEDLEKRKK